ncbi:maturation of SSU-rRNA from tricistronic rRNA transcript protein [Malassezia pachydermatis]|uniref:Protein BFR2 n=1 Tax=Malassezia pachydermatis TaxID=77020 RepID=A0A0M8MUV7_9BASI|nr:traub-domain-containing protein [Malassezia pachydermatis]KOS14071.1 traub-domain-containing protein [Malassezia pachydermatis]
MARLDLDKLLDVAPETIDPENDTYVNPSDSEAEEASSGEEEAEATEARRHYVDMGPSQMRRKARLTESDALDQPKYKSIKTSREEMFGDDFDDDEEITSESDDSLEGEDLDEDDSLAEEKNEGEIDSDEEEVEEEDGDDDDDDEQQLVVPPKKAEKKSRATPAMEDTHSTADTLATQQQESQTLLQQLHAKRSQDAKKGRQVQKQIRNWEKALRLRIALQKVVTSVGRMPSASQWDTYLDKAPEVRDDLDAAAVELEDLAANLQTIRTQLWKTNVPSLAKELATVHPDASASKALSTLESIIEPQRRALLARWSAKIAAAPDSRGTSAAARLQLRAMNQGVVEQIDQALAGEGLRRLIDRTRVWRGEGTERLGVAATDDEDTSTKVDPDVFDDSDFYAQLLRDLIDNASMVEAGMSATASDALQSRKRKRTVDVRASKGRRLRYDVMEKVQSFMPPIPNTKWDDAQIERLFTRLASVAPAVVEETVETTDDVPVDDGFRLLG